MARIHPGCPDTGGTDLYGELLRVRKEVRDEAGRMAPSSPDLCMEDPRKSQHAALVRFDALARAHHDSIPAVEAQVASRARVASIRWMGVPGAPY